MGGFRAKSGRGGVVAAHRLHARSAWLDAVALALGSRFVVVSREELAERTSEELMRAHAWATLGEAEVLRPAWLPSAQVNLPRCRGGGAQMSFEERTGT